MIEGLLAALPAGDASLERVRRVADELAQRFAAVQRSGMSLVGPSATTSALVLLPWVRAGRAVEPAWDELVAVDNAPQTRELLGALPQERRERAILAWLRSNPAQPGLRAQIVAQLLALAPTDALLAGYRAFLAELEANPTVHPRVVADGRAAADAAQAAQSVRPAP